MAFKIEPEVSQWIRQSNKFTIFFRAFDNYGNKCTKDNLSIQISITYDGTMPDLTNATEIKGDASGLIFLNINKPCIITVYGKFARDINDLSQGFITQEIALNYEIDFMPNILSINAKYNGKSIPITESFDIQDIIVTANMSDNTIKTIDINDCILISDLYIHSVGDNIKYFQYYDKQLKITWNFNVNIPGIIKLISLKAIYTGSIKKEGERIDKSEIKAILEYENDYGIHTRELDAEEWTFLSIPVVMYSNDGIINIQYETLDTSVIIPFISNDDIHINAWYEGLDVQVGKSFVLDDVVIMLIIPNGDQKRLKYTQVQFSNTIVEKEGWNWYTITYHNQYQTYTQEFAVKGYIPIEYPDLEFKVLYIDKNNHEIDYTEKFREKFTVNDTFIISWKQFLVEVNELMLYGLYILTAPKLCGLSNKYDQDWEVLCINKTTLKASIMKTYLKEEDLPWQEQNQLEQQ